MPSLSRPLAVIAVALHLSARRHQVGMRQGARAHQQGFSRTRSRRRFFVDDVRRNPNDDPVFYWRNFVVDASEGQEQVGIGSWSAVDRIRWDIHRRRCCTLAAPTTRTRTPTIRAAPARSSNGTIVAAYPIPSHFDIKRAPQPADRRSSLNVIVENTTGPPLVSA